MVEDMKRHAALKPLSHDHHHALWVALLLRRATVENAFAARRALLEFWDGDAQEHFHEEEELVAASVGLGHPLGAALFADHERLRERIEAVAVDPGVPLEELHALGVDLRDHVRFEERRLFPLLERELPLPLLEALAD